MAVAEKFASIYPLVIGGVSIPVYIAIAALVVNLFLCVVFTFVFRILAVADGEDLTTPLDYVRHPVGTGIKHVRHLLRYVHVLPQTPFPEPSFARKMYH